MSSLRRGAAGLGPFFDDAFFWVAAAGICRTPPVDLLCVICLVMMGCSQDKHNFNRVLIKVVYIVESRGENVTGGAKKDRLRHPRAAKHASLSFSAAA